VSAACARHFFFSQPIGGFGGDDLHVAALRVIHPFLHIGRIGRDRIESGAQHIQIRHIGIDESLQVAPLQFQIVRRCQLLRQDQVISRLCFVSVGDGGGADLEIAFCLFQLLRDGRFLRGVQLHGVLRDQHIKIDLGTAQDEILLRTLELRFGDGHLQF